ncbi:MAG TPA: amino acid adenylation domain-containing protein, partial [Thermoanaerobaculia bacterium]|nr:amino acid adenylation domain-containing protein [Thermoanaerobaculia bacterium]
MVAVNGALRTTVQVLEMLRSRDVKLWAEGGKLKYSAPPGALTADLLAELKARKGELLAFLRQGAAARRSGTLAGITAAHHERPPLSFAQQRLWLLHQLFPQSAGYNIARAVRLRGKVRVDRLAASLTAIVRRHGSLRTTFAADGGEPVQVVAPPPEEVSPLPLADLRALPAGRREPEAWRLAQEDARRPFDLARGPLLRVFLLQVDDEDFIAPSTLHHAVGDGWSSGLLFREMGLAYAALARGETPELPPLPVQYTDYAVWQRQWLMGDALAEQLAWWKEQLAGAPQELDLPTDRPRAAARSDRGGRRTLLLPKPLTEALRAFSQAQGATLFMILLAAWQTLLGRIANQDDVVVGSPVANRNRAEIEGLIGCFLNTLVLRTVFRGDPTFRAVLAAVRETALGAYAHQDLPFEKIVEELRPERSLTQTPLFQVILTLHNVPAPDLEVADFRMTLMPPTSRTSTLDLAGNLQETPAGVETSLIFKEDLFDGTTVERLAGHFLRLLGAVAADPGRTVRGLPLLAEAERHQLLREHNDTFRGAAPEGGLYERIAAQAGRTPDAVALASASGVVTYRELRERAGSLAAHLRRLGVGPEVLVGLAAERSAALVVGALGILAAGGAYVPLDPSYPRERLEMMLGDSAAPVLLVDERSRGALAPPPGVRVAGLCAGPPESGGVWTPVPAESTAYVIYTSGSTGRPKGVRVSHGALLSFLDSMAGRPGLGAGDVMLALTSLSFDIAALELYLPLLTGARLELVEREVAADGGRLAERIAASGATVVQATPATWRMLIESGWTGDPRLKVLCGGEALPDRLAAELLARCGEVWNLYGPTETTVWSAVSRLAPGEPVRLGEPIDRTSLYLLGPALAPVPLGVAGELCIGGAGLARGYHGQPELTAERFLPDPWGDGPGARLYRTGDLARRDGRGRIEFLGRLDHQVKVRGFRIELGEIEAVLATLPGVREAAVVARSDRSDRSVGSPGDQRLVAYVVGDATAEELRRSLRERLPDFMVPAAFVSLAALPLTPNGKVDRKTLPAPDWQSPAASSLAPRTPAEEVVAGIWAELLSFERAGASDHFFNLGGHSLLAMRVTSRVRDAFGIELALRDLFEAPVLADFAARIEAARRAGLTGRDQPRLTPPLVPVPRQGPLPLSFAQQRLWFIDRLEPGSSLYNIPVALRVEGPLDSGVLARSLGEIVRRHEALRTAFVALEGAPVQVIQPAEPFHLPEVDLSGLPGLSDGSDRSDRTDPSDLKARQALTLVREESLRPFDLSGGSLLRGLLLRLAEGDRIAAVTLHHIASDGWSTGILVREVAALYAAFVEGRPSPLPELPVQLADFAVWQRSWLHGEVLEGEISFWRRQLAGLPPLLELPTDHPRPAVQSFRGAARPVRLPAALTRQVQRLGGREGTTLFMALLAAFQALLARYSGQDDLAVGSPVAGRNRVELEGLIGFFVNTLVLRSNLTGEPTFRELLGRVRETALAAYLHQDVPFEKLVEELAPRRSLAYTPLFQVMFALQNAPGENLEVRDLRLRPVRGTGAAAKFDLALNLAEHDGGLGGAIEYATDLFDGTTIDRLIGHLERLLASFAASPERPLSEISVLSEAERHQLRTEWNDTAAPVPPGIVERFAAQVRRAPDAVAVVLAGDEARGVTYRELDRRADLLAGRLRALGVGPQVPVGLCVEQTPELAVAVLGIFKSGGALLALDSTYPPARLSFLLADAAVPVLVGPQHLLETFPSHGARTVLLDGEEGIDESTDNGAGPASGDLAYLIYTSGTTGQPKAVPVEHGMLAATLAATQKLFLFAAGDRMPCLALSTFDISLFELLSPLLTGGTAVLFPLRPALDVELLVDCLGEMTCLHAVPALMRGIIESLRRRSAAAPGRKTEAPDVTGIRAVFAGGDAVPADLLEDLRETFPAARVWVLYGPTEGTIVCAAHPMPPPPAPARPLLGRPLAGAVLHVCSDDGELQPAGVPGELWIGGAGVTRGYLGRDELTAEKYVLRDAERFYRTGDRARRLADGTLEFLGRLDHQVKIRGFRIELGEIEAALASLPGVRQAALLAWEEPSGDRRLVAYVVGDAKAEALRQGLRERLSDYMVPAAFVSLPALPLTPHGKLDRTALPAPEQSGAREGFVAPRTPVEEVLACIWSEVLGIERVGADDDFFDLGGHSLLATRVVSRLRGAFVVEVPLRDLFEAPTLAGLAAR